MSRATALASVGQQLSISTGVAVGALMVELSLRFRGAEQILVGDFTLAFVVVALISGSSALVFRALPANAGAEMSGHTPAAATKAEPIAAGETSDTAGEDWTASPLANVQRPLPVAASRQ